MDNQFMKKTLCLAVALAAFNLTPAFGQPVSVPTPRPVPPVSASVPGYGVPRAYGIHTDATLPALTKFNLDFPGGAPKELVAAIEKAMGKSVNVIIGEEDAEVKLPPIKVNDVDVPSLFKTLSENSKKYDVWNNRLVRDYGFQTLDSQPTDNSLWTFYYHNNPVFPTQTQFSIDFHGGSPTELVKVIEKSMGKPINVIINKEDENIEIPPLKMDSVCLSQLFGALEAASRKTVAVAGNGFSMSYNQVTSSYGFKSDQQNPNDSSVWYFHVEKPSLPPVVATQKTCRFYNLSPYLDRGFTVDDITTAIQTGWKMSGETVLPELNYHKETKLLIAYGEPTKLQTITDVLQTLPTVKTEYIAQINRNISGLSQQVQELQKQISKSGTNSVPEEKSGK